MAPRPLLFVWPIGALFWAVWLWAYRAEFRLVRTARREQHALRADRRDPSLWPLLGGLQITMLTAVAVAFVMPRWAITQYRLAAYLTGVLVFALAGLLRRHCFQMLGADFRGAVTVRPGQPVVERGAYRWVRHPSYAAGLLFLLGLGLALGHWGALLVLTAGGLAAYGYRIRVEERALVAELGAAYADYRGRTKRLIPGIW